MKRLIIIPLISLAGCCLVPQPSTPAPRPPCPPGTARAPEEYVRSLGLIGCFSPEEMARSIERGPIKDPFCDIPGQVSTIEGTCVWPNYDEEEGIGEPASVETAP